MSDAPNHERGFSKLGAVVARNDWANAEIMMSAAQHAHSDAYWFVRHMCSIRVRKQYAPTVDTLLQMFQESETADVLSVRCNYRQLYTCMKAFYSAYLCLRKVAAPHVWCLSAGPPGHHTKDVRRWLAGGGLAVRDPPTLREQAESNVTHLLQAMSGRQCVLWMDNFYKQRFGVCPTETDHSLNGTVVAVMLNVPTLGPFRGYPSERDILQRLPLRVAQFRRDEMKLLEFVRGCVGTIARTAVRVPLDVPRGRRVGQKWRPFTLEDVVIGSCAGLMSVIQLAHDVVRHSTHTVPVLADENIHYRVMRLLYAREYIQHPVRQAMAPVVWIYGVWHAYKFLCVHVHRSFFSQFCFVDQGLLSVGDHVSTVQKLPFIERSIASIWIAGKEIMPQLDREILRIDTFLRGVLTRGRNDSRVVPSDRQSEEAWLHDMFHGRMAGSSRVYITNRLFFSEAVEAADIRSVSCTICSGT